MGICLDGRDHFSHRDRVDVDHGKPQSQHDADGPSHQRAALAVQRNKFPILNARLRPVFRMSLRILGDIFVAATLLLGFLLIVDIVLYVALAQ